MNIAIVLGSGGHTSELVQIISNLPQVSTSNPSIFYSTDDTISISKYKNVIGDSIKVGSVHPIPRARHVGQSYFTSIFSSLYSFIAVVWIFLKHFPPRLIICNGPAINVSLVLAGLFVNFISFGIIKRPKVVYIESVARTRSLSLTGKIMIYLADSFMIQWPGLAKKYQHRSNVVYTGLLV